MYFLLLLFWYLVSLIFLYILFMIYFDFVAEKEVECEFKL